MERKNNFAKKMNSKGFANEFGSAIRESKAGRVGDVVKFLLFLPACLRNSSVAPLKEKNHIN